MHRCGSPSMGCGLASADPRRLRVVSPTGAFENTVQALYKYVVPKPKSECSKTEQLGVSFAAGYIAGVFCAVVSQPADNLVSKMNAQKAPVSLLPGMGTAQPSCLPPGLL
jgi:hypothetical protein